MHADDLRFNPRVVASAKPADIRAELARLGFSGDVRDLAPPRIGTMCVAMEGLTAAEAYELRSRWAAGGGQVLVAGEPFATAAVPAVVTGTAEQFERAAGVLKGFAPAEALVRAARAWGAAPGPILGLEFGKRTHLMGIVNVTPDSFSDGGKFPDAAAAVEHGERLAAQGADLLDVGGESTRPGAADVPADEEARRAVPVVRELAKRVRVPISIDTTKASVARQALDAGATVINDISGLRFDRQMSKLAAERRAPVVVMHIQGTPRTMQHHPAYRDVVGEIASWLRESLAIAGREGLPEELLIVDPGIGFGKTVEHNLEILHRLRELRTLGRPILVGASRKTFLGKLTGLDVAQRLLPSAAAASLAIAGGADILRVHDVAETDAVRKVADATARFA